MILADTASFRLPAADESIPPFRRIRVGAHRMPAGAIIARRMLDSGPGGS